MTNQSIIDPFALWKTIYEQTENNFSEAIHETLGKEEYAELLGQVQNGYLQYQKLIQSTTEMYLKQLNIPTREEISSVASLVINLEEKVEILDEKIDEATSDQKVLQEINKLKTSFTRLDKKMSQILQALSDNEKSGSASSTPTTPAPENK
ncbi:poly(R)-hydroxyalkanoic acid synthase subunit PhaE [Oceanobacillus piezotolerans]|uniref:poly(R)-hydroxyalkanoic acid synthase subunit PhaE n=1 Tax=Oceanobacillus piezotolerans TaxID=2448030 RepID=UPI001313DD57|nr:poly(R)-hydroxyalkanoic acid synthase subunit PhaE [Oceanobacillus piezotolerans]